MLDKQFEMENEKNIFGASEQWTLVQISTPTCPPCQVAKKDFEEDCFLPYKYIDATKQDIEKYRMVTKIHGVPHFFIEKGFKTISIGSGYGSKERLENKIKEIIESQNQPN